MSNNSYLKQAEEAYWFNCFVLTVGADRFLAAAHNSGVAQGIERISEVYKQVRAELELKPETWEEMKQKLIAEVNAVVLEEVEKP